MWKFSFNLTFIALLLISISCYFYVIPIFNLTPFWSLQVIQWFQFGLVLLITSRFMPAPSILAILICYVISRTLLLKSAPWIEDDYYRYLWDGRLVTEGINPYLLPPDDNFWLNVPSLWRQHINFPSVTTIYPPLAQLYFALIYFLFGESVLGLRIGCIIIEFILAGLIYKVLKKNNRDLKTLAVFLFFPTLLKENINSVHFDLLAGLFFFLFYYFIKSSKISMTSQLAGWASLAAGVLTKLFPLLFLPLALFTSKWPYRGLLLFVLLVLTAYYPFLDPELHVFKGTQTFAKNWMFFESLPYYIQNLYLVLGRFSADGSRLINAIESGLMTRLTMSALLILLTLWVSYHKRLNLENKIVILFLLLFAFTTVLNTWYWLWALPFLILFAPRFVWVLPVFTTLGYSWFENPILYHQLHYPFYGFIILGFIAYIYKTNPDAKLML